MSRRIDGIKPNVKRAYETKHMVVPRAALRPCKRVRYIDIYISNFIKSSNCSTHMGKAEVLAYFINKVIALPNI